NPSNGTYTVDPDTDTVSGNFTPIPTSAPWILGTSSYRWDNENGVTGSFFETCYDGSTGFLFRTRAHTPTSSGQSAADLVTDYGRNGQGNVTAEKSYGGDVQQGIGIGNVCAFAAGGGLPAGPAADAE